MSTLNDIPQQLNGVGDPSLFMTDPMIAEVKRNNEIAETAADQTESLVDAAEVGKLAKPKLAVRKRRVKRGGVALATIAALTPVAIKTAKLIAPYVKRGIQKVVAKIREKKQGGVIAMKTGDLQRIAKELARKADRGIMRALVEGRIKTGAGLRETMANAAKKVWSGIKKAAPIAAKVAPIANVVWKSVGHDLLKDIAPGITAVGDTASKAWSAYEDLQDRQSKRGKKTTPAKKTPAKKTVSIGDALAAETRGALSGSGISPDVIDALIGRVLDADTEVNYDAPLISHLGKDGCPYHQLMRAGLERIAARLAESDGSDSEDEVDGSGIAQMLTHRIARLGKLDRKMEDACDAEAPVGAAVSVDPRLSKLAKRLMRADPAYRKSMSRRIKRRPERLAEKGFDVAMLAKTAKKLKARGGYLRYIPQSAGNEWYDTMDGGPRSFPGPTGGMISPFLPSGGYGMPYGGYPSPYGAGQKKRCGGKCVSML